MSLSPPTETDGLAAEAPVFLHYTQAELDRNFNQRTWAPNAESIIAQFAERSVQTRAKLHHTTVQYGETTDESLDIFPAGGEKTPITIFVHGGAWLNFSKDDFSFVAGPMVAAGVTTVVLNFSNLPKITLPAMIAQVRRGIRWVSDNAASFGGDREALCVAGWSSGAHLAAMALSPKAADRLPAKLVKLAFCISGPFDMEPVMLSARSAYVKIGKHEERALSPHHNAASYETPFFIAYADNDTDEFQRQSRAFAKALEAARLLAGMRCCAGFNHFELALSLADEGSLLSTLVIDECRRAVAKRR